MIKSLKTVLLLLVLIMSSEIYSQNKNFSDIKYWAQGGIGISAIKFAKSDVGFSFGIGIFIDYKSNLIAIKHTRNYELALFLTPNEKLWSSEILYGRRMDFKMRGMLFPLFPFGLLIKKEFNYSFNASIGASIIGGINRKTLLSDEFLDSHYSSEGFTYFGLPIEVELIERLTNNIGLGLCIYSNINKEKNIYGIMSNFYFGLF